MNASDGTMELLGRLRRRIGDDDVLTHIDNAYSLGQPFQVLLFVAEDGSVGDPDVYLTTHRPNHRKRRLQPFA